MNDHKHRFMLRGPSGSGKTLRFRCVTGCGESQYYTRAALRRMYLMGKPWLPLRVKSRSWTDSRPRT